MMTQRTRGLILGAAVLVLLGLNLRAGVTSAATLFHGLETQLGYPDWVGAALPTIPTLCFAFAGAATSRLVHRFGLELTILLSLSLLTLGLMFRGIPTTWALLLGTVVSMCGLAVCNVSMPALVRTHFASRTATMTALYTFSMSSGATLAATVGVPLAAVLGSATTGLAIWSLLGVAAIIVFIPFMLRYGSRSPGANASVHGGASVQGSISAQGTTTAAAAAADAEPQPLIPRNDRGPSMWQTLKDRHALLITVVFCVQGFLAYGVMSWYAYMLTTTGLSDVDAGLYFGLMQLVGVFGGMTILTIGSRPGLQALGMAIPAVALIAGFVAMLIDMPGTAWFSAAAMGMGLSIFPLLLTVISRAGRTSVETTAVSTTAQSIGYLFSALGPFSVAMLHTATGSWTASLVTLLVMSAILLVTAIALGRSKPEHAPEPIIVR